MTENEIKLRAEFELLKQEIRKLYEIAKAFKQENVILKETIRLLWLPGRN